MADCVSGINKILKDYMASNGLQNMMGTIKSLHRRRWGEGNEGIAHHLLTF